MRYRFVSSLWQYPGDGAWHFITLPADISSEIKLLTSETKRGFGSVRVSVDIGGYPWNTSIFPDRASGCYLLPVKKVVRHTARLSDGDEVAVELSLLI